MIEVKEEKRCAGCAQMLPATREYFYYHKDRPWGKCKPCNTVVSRERRRRYRLAALAAYGGKCACCDDDTYEFLGIDHINGGGGKHRKELTAKGTHIYFWLKQQGYPDGFRVLCHNCNIAIGLYGLCPHQLGT